MKVVTDPNQIDKFKWDAFVYNHPNGNIFQTSGMYEVYKNTKDYEPIFVSITDDNKIEAILLAIIQKEDFGLLSFLTARSIIYGGPLIVNEKPDLLDIVLKRYNKLIKKKAIYSQIRNFWDIKRQEGILKKNGFKIEDHLNIINDLCIPIEKQWNNLSKSRRKGINKAKKKGFVFEDMNIKTALSPFLKLLQNLYLRIKLPTPPMSYFENLAKILGEKGQTKIFNLRNDNEIVISMFGFLYKKTIYGFYVGHLDNNYLKETKAMDLFFWDLFNWGSVNGFEKFDWMGAGKPNKEYGVRDFKLQYGGALVNFGRCENIHQFLLYKIALIGLYLWKRLK
jgi:serine/alanine adding enzyme